MLIYLIPLIYLNVMMCKLSDFPRILVDLNFNTLIVRVNSLPHPRVDFSKYGGKPFNVALMHVKTMGTSQ